MRLAACTFVVAAFAPSLVVAQSEFEVASIRETVDGVRVLSTFESSANRAQYHGYAIVALIAEAYNVREDLVTLAPGVDPATVYPMMASGKSARIYEIAALASEGATPTRDQFRAMLQSLLTSRFRLATHTEKRDRDVYVLKVDGTPQLKPNTGEGTCRVNGSRVPQGQKMTATHCPVKTMLGNLFVDRPVYDETGLTGFYDWEFTSALPFQLNDPDAISPFSAVKDLGLKLEAKRIPVDFIVIDHVEPPTEN